MTTHTLWKVSLLLIVAAVSVLPASAQVAAFEDFNDGIAQGWESDGGWNIDDGALFGEGAGGFFYTASEFSNLFLDFELISLQGGLMIYPAAGDGPAPAVNLSWNGDTMLVVLFADAFAQRTAIDRTTYDYNAWLEETGGTPLTVSLTYQDGMLEVSLGGQSVISAEYDERPPSGIVGFEVFDSLAVIDNVYIEPLASVFGPDEQAGAADVLPVNLRVMRADPISDSETYFEIDVTVANQGEIESLGGMIYLYSPDAERVSHAMELPPLTPGTQPVLTFAFSAFDLAQKDVVFAVTIEDPSDGFPDNNTYEARAFRVPVYTPPGAGGNAEDNNNDGGFIPLALIIGGGAAAMLAIAGLFGGLTIRRVRRVRFQKEARPRHPEGDCSGRGTEVEVETEIELRPSHVTLVRLYGSDPQSGEDAGAYDLKNRELNRALTSAIHVAALHTARENWAEPVEKAAGELASGLIAFGRKQGRVLNVRAAVHIEGIELQQTYTIYRCRGHQWKKGPQWTARRTVQRDDELLKVAFLDPEGTSLARRLSADLEAMLYTYLESLAE